MRWLILLLCSSLAAARPAPGLDRDTKHRVLWDRFSIELPFGMTVVPNPRDSVGLALPKVLSTRAVLDESDGRFVMIATDTLTHMPYDFQAAVTREMSRMGMDAKITQDEHLGFWAVHVDPVPPRKATDPNLVHATYVRGPDKRVTVFAFFLIGDSLLPYADSWARVARDATSSIAYRADAGAWDREGSMRAGEGALSITVPRPWAVFGLVGDQNRTEGLLLREEGLLGVVSGTCNVDTSLSRAPRTAASRPARWLGRDASWRTWQTKSVLQAEIEVKFGDLRIRGWCTAGNADGLREAQRIVGEMTMR